MRARSIGLRGLAATLLALAVLTGARASAAEPPAVESLGGALVEVCAATPLADLPELDGALCKSIDAGSVLAGTVCALLPVPAQACAALTDGRAIDASTVSAYVASWAPRALRLQARLDEGHPLTEALVPHTHNSFNARRYGLSVATADPNQMVSVGDQLRMGIRFVELDLHWFPSLPAGGNDVVLCHGQVATVADLDVHVGCSLDRPLAAGLAEIARFLAAPGNEDELVFVYLENKLDDDPVAHARAVSLLEEHLGDLVARPRGAAEGDCADLPVDRSRRSFLDAGRRVVLVGNCGPGAWSSWVYERGPAWDERGNSDGYPTAPDCATERAGHDYEGGLIRVFEDTTWLSAITGSPAPVSNPEVQAMVRCGVNLIGLDRVVPGDPRLASLVWSWAPDEPAASGGCAAWGADARFRASDCGAHLRPACLDAAGAWVVPAVEVAWADAFAACRGVGATFAVPWNGWQNELVRRTVDPPAEGAGDVVWLNYAQTAAGWTPDLAAAPSVAAPSPSPSPAPAGPPTDSGRLPATGTTVPLVPAVLAVLLALLALRLRRPA